MKNIISIIRKFFILYFIFGVLLQTGLAQTSGVIDVDERVSKRSPVSRKKGFGIVPGKYPDWKQRLQSLRVRWFYRWNSGVPTNGPADIEFVPMVWGVGRKTDEICRQLTQARENKTCRHLLGYNEPNSRKQKMSVSTGIAAWPKLMATGLRLGSPAIQNRDPEWLAEFMTEVDQGGYRVDFIAVHWYASGNPHALIKRLKKLYRTYHRPIWLTEFALADWHAGPDHPNRYTPEDAYRFMETAVKELEALDFVERYAWFTSDPEDPVLGPSALFNKDGTLTKLGQLYAAY